jgi:hypothetical protein
MTRLYLNGATIPYCCNVEFQFSTTVTGSAVNDVIAVDVKTPARLARHWMRSQSSTLTTLITSSADTNPAVSRSAA